MAAFLRMVFLLLTLAPSALAQETRGAIALSRETPGQAFSRSLALVIGIDGYDGGWPALHMAVADAEAVAGALRDAGFDEVEVARDADAAALSRLLKHFIYVKGADPDARLLIWFAGHGHTIGRQGYLVPRDAPMPDGTPTGEAAFQASAIAMSDFARYMSEVKARHVLAIFDSCFSGSVFDANRASAPASALANQARLARQFIASGQAGETSADDGAFRRAFVTALGGGAREALGRDGALTGARLGAYLAETISASSRGRQNPVYATSNVVGLDRGDFLFPRRFDTADAGAPAPIAVAEAPSAAEPETPQLYVEDFTFAPGDERGDFLAMKLQRNLVEYYVVNRVYVASPRGGSGPDLPPNRLVRGDVRIFGDEIFIEAVLSDASGRAITTASLSAPVGFALSNYRSLAVAIHYLFDVSLRDFLPLRSASRPTRNGHAYALFLSARQRAEAGDLAGATAALETAVAADPGFASAYGALADLAERDGGAAPKAAELRAKARAIDPDYLPLAIFGETDMGDPVPALAASGRSRHWDAIADGVEQRRLDADPYNVSVLAWRLDETRVRLRIDGAPDANGLSAGQFRNAGDAILAINGGYFELDAKRRVTPTGLLVVDGRRVNAFDRDKARNPLTGILYSRDGRVGIMWARDYRDTDRFDFALQTGPLVVDPGGRNGIYRNAFDRQNRSAVCLDAAGRPIVVAVSGGLSLFEFGRLLAIPEPDGGLGCERAINLDGGPSTQVSVGAEGASLELPGLWNVASAVVVARR